MIMQEVIDRLLSLDPPVFGLVAGAAELGALKDAPAALPAAYAFVEREAGGDNTRLNGTLQRVEMDFAVVLVTRNVSDATGAAAIADIETLKAIVRGALVGWQPPSAEDAIIFVGGELVRSKGGTVWWQETYGAATYLEDK